MRIAFSQFSGLAPRISPRLLPANLAQQAIDVKMWSGELRPHFGDTLIKRIPAGTKSIYKYKHLNVYDMWFAWPFMVNVVKGPVYADEPNKIYLTGVGDEMRVTSSLLIDRTDTTVDETNSYLVGIPAPENVKMSVDDDPRLKEYNTMTITDQSGASLFSGQITTEILTNGLEVTLTSPDSNVGKVGVYVTVMDENESAIATKYEAYVAPEMKASIEIDPILINGDYILNTGDVNPDLDITITGTVTGTAAVGNTVKLTMPNGDVLSTTVVDLGEGKLGYSVDSTADKLGGAFNGVLAELTAPDGYFAYSRYLFEVEGRDRAVYAKLTTDRDGNYYISPEELTITDGVIKAKIYVASDSSLTEESRSYVVCFIRKWDDGQIDVGQASQPAKTTSGNLTVDVVTGQPVTIYNIVPPTDWEARHINGAYIYRTEISDTGEAVYSFVDEISITSSAAVQYIDTKSSEDLAEALTSMYYDPPVSGGRGLVSLNNGIFAMFKDTNVYLSEMYQPHAWPYEYKITVDYPVVGLGAFGNTLVICTEAMPVLAVVQDPSNPTIKPIQEALPCVSARSIVNTRTGVIFASTSGLVLVNSTAPVHITEKLISKDEWSTMNPSSLYGEFLENTYYGFFTEPKEVMGFVFDLDNYSYSTTYNTIVQSGLIYTSIPTMCSWSDVSDSNVYRAYKPDYADDLNLVSMHTAQHTNKTFRWRSKIISSPEGLFTLAAARVMFDLSANQVNRTYPIIIEPLYLNAAINRWPLNFDPVNGWMYITIVGDGDQPNTVIFNYYVDGVLKYTKRVLTNQPFRLPSGFRGDYAEVEIKSNAWIHSVVVASSMAECVEGTKS